VDGAKEGARVVSEGAIDGGYDVDILWIRCRRGRRRW
jgi:hypothetical protein